MAKRLIETFGVMTIAIGLAVASGGSGAHLITKLFGTVSAALP